MGKESLLDKGPHGLGIVEGVRLSRGSSALLQDMKTTVRHNFVLLNTFPCSIQLLTHSKAGRNIRQFMRFLSYCIFVKGGLGPDGI